jgi:hypothetical protein
LRWGLVPHAFVFLAHVKQSEYYPILGEGFLTLGFVVSCSPSRLVGEGAGG